MCRGRNAPRGPRSRTPRAVFTSTSPSGPPNRIETSVDGRAYFSFAREPQGGRATWPFDAPQHLLLNVAVGGNWGGQRGVDDTTLPYRFFVDYVRVYQRTP